MERDYGELLRLAEELQYFTGYLDSEDIKRRTQAQGLFDAERRKVVYELFQEGKDHQELSASVAWDMDRIASTSTDHSPGAIAEAREALMTHIDRQGRNSPLMRFIVRWGPPALGVAAAIAYVVLRMRR